ncbi:MAG: sortase B protein-sorting domain-containing protein [Desulfobacula sp.]|nr:sortase B protein-sorting domain-containing protein [Desulfobacula sp.]MBT3486083.1 sortase B protein-sorting domain-containing protein [Desulfobacula sp.]MBT3804459.1 sortase B protein-sorting domain-containing protein [Desulfobacula sp.]MBT4024947.1 sortase B protein-sorting domain-containing protein [Desulfobacula sp.]MBT4198821.1 sortase B protein-sorting domain-containing protein [Desulfobacula sp.]
MYISSRLLKSSVTIALSARSICNSIGCFSILFIGSFFYFVRR